MMTCSGDKLSYRETVALLTMWTLLALLAGALIWWAA